MPTKIEYFELIDSRIEDKTAEGSISKVDVSQSLKDSFDYTDQEVNALSDEVYGALDTKADLTSTNNALATKASITYVDTEIDNAIDGLYYDAGNYDASVGTFPTTIFDGSPVTKGATFNVSVAGTLGGVSYAQGESFRALVDTPGQTTGNWAKSLYVPLQATEVGLGTVRYATDSEVGSSTGDGVITAGQIPLLPAGTPSLTSGIVSTTTTSPYNELEYGINTIDGTGIVRVSDPSTTPTGTVKYVKGSGAYSIRSYDGTSKLSLGGTNSYEAVISVLYPNITYRLMHLGSGFWQVEYVNQRGFPPVRGTVNAENNNNNYLTNTVNDFYSDVATYRASLPEAQNTPIGYSLIVFAFSDGVVRGNNSNTAVINTSSTTATSNHTLKAGDIVRYTKVSSSNWIVEYIYPFSSNKRIYKALLSQSGTSNPTRVVLEGNIVQGNPVASRIFTGTYTLTLTGAFTSNKTFLKYGGVPSGYEVVVKRTDANTISIETFFGGVHEDGVLDNFPIEIEVYN